MRAVTEFDEIRPYRDDEVAAVLRRLESRSVIVAGSLALRGAVVESLGAAARALAGRKKTAARVRRRSIRSMRFRTALATVFQRMIDDTTDGFTVSGMERLEPDLSHLFISNHRDITLDSGFMNLALFRAGHPTTRMAIGDNLLRTGYAADVMRLNKGFVVHRGKRGAKMAFASMSLTSRYIRHSLENRTLGVDRTTRRPRKGRPRPDRSGADQDVVARVSQGRARHRGDDRSAVDRAGRGVVRTRSVR